MDGFVLKDVCSNIQEELENVGFDNSYLKKASDKFRYKNIKIFKLTVAQANILKQTAISVGADCAVARETITGKIEETDCILGGSFSQLRKIADKLEKQPFKLKELAAKIKRNLEFKLASIKLKERLFDFSTPYVVGILNLTKDSFSDGGEFLDFDNAKKHLLKMVEEGADIIDIGAESTKPFSLPVGDENQLELLLPILDFVKESGLRIPISVDTRSAWVAKACIEAGADLINDVSGFDYDKKMVEVVAESNVPVIIQHSLGTPENMQINPTYSNLMDDIFVALNNKIIYAIQCGIKRENIIIDPGIGFGKTREQNLEILKRLDEFKSLSCPIMIGISRKSFLNLKDEPNEIKDIFTLALSSELLQSANFLRVHDVKLHSKLVDIKGLKH